MLLVWINNLMATVNRTIGSASDDGLITALRISVVTGTGPYDLTMNQDVNYNVTIGDFVLDESSDTYVVSAVTDLAHFEVTDELGVGHAPITGDVIVDRAYTTLTLAEADISNTAASGDTLNWKVMADSLISDSVSFNDGTLTSTGTLNITAPSGERHGGVAGAGTRIQADGSSATPIIVSVSDNPVVTITHLEIIGFGDFTGAAEGVQLVSSTGGKITLDSLILHGWLATSDSPSAARVIDVTNFCDVDVDIQNCLIFDASAGGFNVIIEGINMGSGATGVHRIMNCTVFIAAGVLESNSRGLSPMSGSTADDRIAQNCAVFATNPFNLASQDWSASSGNNCTDASSAPGSSNQVNESPALIFVDAAANDYNPLTGRALDDNGADLSAIFTADLEGTTRSTPWTIGAYHDTTAAIAGGSPSGGGGPGASETGPTGGGSSGLGIGI